MMVRRRRGKTVKGSKDVREGSGCVVDTYAAENASHSTNSGKRKRKHMMEETDVGHSKEEESTSNKAIGKRKVLTDGKKKHVNETDTKFAELDFHTEKLFSLKISSWNVAGLRAWISKGGLGYIERENPDIFCLQEIKCVPENVPSEARISGYESYWYCKPGGHAGVAIYSKEKPSKIEYGIGDIEYDEDGRMLIAEYENFFVICVYVPNSGRGLVNLQKRLRWNNIFNKRIEKLNDIKPVIIAGDMNVSHNEIDLANPKSNKRSAGFTTEEREDLTKFLSLGYIDVFRNLYPDAKDAYTYWTYMANARKRNIGWRLDYFIVSERIMPKVVDCMIRSKVLGSDHCPVTLLIDI